VADELRWIAQTSSGSTTATGVAGTAAPAGRLRWRLVAAGVAGLVALVALTAWLVPRLAPRPPGAAGAFRAAGPRAAKRALADRTVERARIGPANPVEVASALAEAGETDAAFAWLEKAYVARTPQLLHVVVLPAFRSIRSDPRYEGLLGRIGIPLRGHPSVPPRPQ
jgi:hypothetical protein